MKWRAAALAAILIAGFNTFSGVQAAASGTACNQIPTDATPHNLGTHYSSRLWDGDVYIQLSITVLGTRSNVAPYGCIFEYYEDVAEFNSAGYNQYYNVDTSPMELRTWTNGGYNGAQTLYRTNVGCCPEIDWRVNGYYGALSPQADSYGSAIRTHLTGTQWVYPYVSW